MTRHWAVVVVMAATAAGWAPGTAGAESREFNNGAGDWNVGENWTPPGVPVAGDRANIREGDTVNVTDSPPATDVTLDGGHLRLGSKEGHIELATGTINLSAGTIEQVATWTRMGDRPGGTLTWNQSGGTARIYHNAGAPSANDATLDFNISGGDTTPTASRSRTRTPPTRFSTSTSAGPASSASSRSARSTRRSACSTRVP